MNQKVLTRHSLGPLTAHFLRDEHTGVVELQVLPEGLEKERATRRVDHLEHPWIAKLPKHMASRPARQSNSLVQVHRRGDNLNPNDPALSLLNSATTRALAYRGQEVGKQDGETIIRTFLEHPDGLHFTHHLAWRQDRPYLECWVEVENHGGREQTLELLSSFSLGGFSPFDRADSPGRLRIHRFRSFWSREGRLLSSSPEEMNMAMPWILAGFAAERFGHAGSWPTHGWFPTIALEDVKTGVCWGAQLAHPGSWQMELYRRDDCLDVAGGLADYNFAHWAKTLAPGDHFETPRACISAVAGGPDELCHRMLTWQEDALELVSEEKDLPIQVNDFCTHWGSTGHAPTLKMLERLKGSPVRYLVIDAGWYKPTDGDWAAAQGDWEPSSECFPEGIAATARAIRDAGFIPGIWFEMEVACKDARAYEKTEHMLTRHGDTICVGTRRFWDFRDPWVVDYLSDRLINFLKQNGFGYLKIDYNASIGIGVDGAESLGEGLRQHLAGVQAFLRRIREALPSLVIENCASGGMRLEPSMMALASLGSFSDCHETVEGPVIAANLHRLILPRQSLIWASMQKAAGERELIYALSGSFLGRMCLSGHLLDISDEQWEVALRAMELYQKVKHLIADGRSHRFGPEVENYRYPRGWQAVLRSSSGTNDALLVAHAFSGDFPEEIHLGLKGIFPAIQRPKIGDVLATADSSIETGSEGTITWRPGGPFTGIVAHIHGG